MTRRQVVPQHEHRVVLTEFEHGHALISVASSWRGTRYDLRPNVKTWMKRNLSEQPRFDSVHRRIGGVIIYFRLAEDAVLFKMFIT